MRVLPTLAIPSPTGARIGGESAKPDCRLESRRHNPRECQLTGKATTPSFGYIIACHPPHRCGTFDPSRGY